MALPRVLLLSGTMPGMGSVGEIFLGDLCRAYRQEFICSFTVRKPGFGVSDPALGAMAQKVVDWSPQSEYCPRSRLGGLSVCGSFHVNRILRASAVCRQ